MAIENLVCEVFLDAIEALFLRGPAGRDWSLKPIFDVLTWYELECIEDLREVMTSRRPDADRRPMPSEARDRVEVSRTSR